MPSDTVRRSSPLLLATAAIWLLSFAIWMTEGAMLRPPIPSLDAALRSFLCQAAGAAMCGAMFLVLRALERGALAVRLGVALALCLAATGAFMTLLFAAYYVVAPLGPAGPRWLLRHGDTAIAILWTFLAWCGIYFSLQFGRELRRNEARLRGAETLALDAQNRMLRYQLDPHFLFNIHSALATLIHDRRNDEAEGMVLGLSAYLRRALDKDPGGKTALSEEFSAVREYMDIEAIRFGERLTFVESVEPGVSEALAPSFILQPLVENAIKHGLSCSTGPTTVRVGAAREGPALRLWVEDDGRGGAGVAGGLGVGLQNVQRRLEALYGRSGRLQAEPLAPHGFRATLTLPLEFA
jgi:hypothetical protein